jgi:hypothetical protein
MHARSHRPIALAAAMFALALMGCDGPKVPDRSWEAGGAVPSRMPAHAVHVAQREAWGCLLAQRVVSDLFREGAGQLNPVVLEPRTRAADPVANWDESVRLAFDGILAEGYLVTRLSFEPKSREHLENRENSDGREKPRFQLRRAVWEPGVGRPTIVLDVEGSGTLRVEVLYARKVEFVPTWFACPEGAIVDPYPLTFYPAYRPRGVDGAVRRIRLEGSQSVRIPIEKEMFDGLQRLARATGALEGILDELGEEEHRFVIVGERLTTDSLDEAAFRHPGLRLALKMDDGEEMRIGDPQGDPALRQRITIRRTDGTLRGAVIWMTVD